MPKQFTQQWPKGVPKGVAVKRSYTQQRFTARCQRSPFLFCASAYSWCLLFSLKRKHTLKNTTVIIKQRKILKQNCFLSLAFSVGAQSSGKRCRMRWWPSWRRCARSWKAGGVAGREECERRRDVVGLFFFCRGGGGGLGGGSL